MRNRKAKILRLKSTELKEMGNGLKLHQGSFRLGIRKNSFAEQGSGPAAQGSGGGLVDPQHSWRIEQMCGCDPWGRGFVVALAVLG